MEYIAQVTSFPYGISSDEPLKLLKQHGINYRLSPHERKHTPAETAALLGDVDVLIAGTEPLSAAVLSKGLPRLKHVARVGVGLDGLDIEFCKEQHIAVTYTPDAPARSVVEQVFGLLISLGRRFIEAHEAMRKGQWQRHTGILLQGKTLGILGCGRIGKQVAVIARQAFGMQVLAHDIKRDPDWAQKNEVHYVSLDRLLSDADAITVHLPRTERTTDMLNRKRLQQMKAGALLLNTSRGDVLDEDALYELLKDGHLGGAALDVYRKEPYRGPLTTLPNIITCCHQGSCSHDGRFAMEMGSAWNAINVKAGNEVPPDNRVWLPGMSEIAVNNT